MLLSSSSLSSMPAASLCNTTPALHVASRLNHSRPVMSCRAMRVTTNHYHNNQPYWSLISDQIEDHLKKVVAVKDPVSVFEPMHHLVFDAPRNTAPALCVAACELLGGDRDQAMAAASALHMIHAAAFTHEQLPLSDRPSLMPMSRPMAHHKFSPKIELLLPDAMIPFGIELLAKSVDPAQNNSDRILRVVIEITRAIRSQQMLNGQDSQLLQVDDLIGHTCEKKEGWLHECGATCGAILGGGSKEEIERLRRYGLYVGMIRGTLQQSLSTSLSRKGSLRVEELRNLASKELEGFDEAKVGAISSFVEGNFCHV